jgi:hypothetical protein
MRPSVIVLVLGTAAALVCGCAGSDGDRGAAAGAPGTPGSSTGASVPPTASAASSAPTADVAAAGPASGDTACVTQDWGTEPEVGSSMASAAPLYLVRIGQHRCYDRVVFDVNGPEAVGYAVRYVPVVRADASDKPVPVAGGAVLEVVVRAPMLGSDGQGHQPSSTIPGVGEDLVAPSRVAGWSSLRQVTFAGSFEGQTTMAVGVRDRLPFRVFVTADQGYRHVVVDVSH